MGQGYTFFGKCKGKTKAGMPCLHMSVFANGFCRQHGGDSTEFMQERLRELKAKTRKKLERWKLQRRVNEAR